MKRFISFAMAMLITLLSVVSCSDTPAEEKETTGQETSAVTPGTEEVETESPTPNWDKVAKTSMNGITIDIACPATSSTYYDTLDFEESTGDKLNDAIFDRNRLLEEQLDFTMNALPNTGSVSALDKAVSAGVGDWDLALGLITNGASLLQKGALRAFNTLPQIDLTNPWYSQSAYDTMSVNGQMFYGMMDFSVDIYESLTVLFFNGELLTRFQLDDPHELYKNKEWTIDKMLEMMEVVANDENGDGTFALDTDMYGLAGRQYDFQPMMFTSGTQIISWNNAEQTFVLDMTSESFLKIAEAIGNVYDKSREGVHYGWEDEARTAFKDGRVLFYSRLLGDYNLLRDAEDDYGVISFPRYSYENEVELFFSQNPNALFLPVVVGDDNGDGKQDYDEIGTFLEAVGAYTYDVTKEIYVENAVIGKGTRDEASADMVRYMINNVGYCLGQSYGFSAILMGCSGAISANANYASIARALSKQFTRLAAKTVESIQEAVEKQAQFEG